MLLILMSMVDRISSSGLPNEGVHYAKENLDHGR
jgi:hypothetical protein